MTACMMMFKEKYCDTSFSMPPKPELFRISYPVFVPQMFHKVNTIMKSNNFGNTCNSIEYFVKLTKALVICGLICYYKYKSFIKQHIWKRGITYDSRSCQQYGCKTAQSLQHSALHFGL